MKAFFSLLALAFGFVVTVAFVRVDKLVGERLAGRQAGGLSMILSGPTEVRSGSTPAKLIKKRLEARRYTVVANEPTAAGEYSITNNSITVKTRPFRTATGEEVPTRTFQIQQQTGEITSAVGQPISAITLEPKPIAPLGSTEVRASSFRSLSQIPRSLQNAFLAIEDRRFYKHWGIDPIGIARAMIKNMRAGRLVEGGSTLTQQLAKNILFTPKKTLGRKVREMFAALSLERRLSKEEILELYLNEIYFSQEGQVSVHGVQEAAQSFFGKDVAKISLAESALLAGLVRAPTSYSPRKNIKRSTKRRDLVLAEMRDQGFIEENEFKSAVAEKISLAPPPFRKKDAPFFAAAIERQMADSFDVEAAAVSGVQVHTWLDPDIQQCAEQAVSESIAAIEKTYPRLRKKHKGRAFEQSLVAVEPFSGAIRAFVGGRDFFSNQFDHVMMARRQIGSTIKPFLYLTALDGSLNSYRVATPISILSDEPTGITLFDHSQWKPKNYDRTFRGDVTLRYALERSLNIPAVYVAQRVGIPALANTLRQFAVSPEIPEFPALALGALDTTLLQLTSAYGALANGGRLVSPRLYNAVIDADGSELAATVHNEATVAQEGPVYLVTDIMRGVVDRGTAQVIRRMGYKGVAAGKTGTSNDTRDAWFVGFTPRLSVGIWTGFDDNSSLGLTGGAASAPTWARFMKCIEPLVEEEQFIRPPSVEVVALDRELFCRASKEHPKERVLTELFVQGTAPAEECSASSSETEGGYPPSADDVETSSYPSAEAIGTSEQPSAEETESQNRNARRQSFTSESQDLYTQPDSDLAAPPNQPLPRRSSKEAKASNNEPNELDEEKWYSRSAEIDPIEKQERSPTKSYKNDTKRDSRDIDYADDYSTDYEDEGTSDGLYDSN
jgi:penicillin-binding protein 1B